MAALDATENVFPPLFDVGAVWQRLWQRRRTVLFSVGGALALALVYLAVTKPTYTATASLLIDPRDARSTQFETVLPGIGADSAAVASQVFVIESRDLLMAVFDGEDIANDPEFAEGGLLSLIGLSPAPTRDAVFRRFERRVTVERAGLTYVIDVSFKSRSAEKAARIANAIVERYRAGLSGERESANADVNTRLGERIALLQQAVAQSDRAVADFRMRHEILDPAAGGTLKDETDQLAARLVEARADADAARDRHEQAVAAQALPAGFDRLAEIVSSATIDRLRSDYNQRAAELANAEAIYRGRHPTIRRLRSELARTRALIGAEGTRILGELKAKRQLADEAVAALEARLAALRGKSQAAGAAQVELRRLEAKAEAARKVLDDVLKRAEETAQMRGLQLSEAKVIAIAAPPVQPSWPTPLLLLPVSAAIGLLGGCCLAVAGGPAARGDPEAAVARDTAEPQSLGRLDLPVLPGASAPARIRALRRHIARPGGQAFLRDMLGLVRRIAARLTEHPAPYRLLISGLDDPAGAKLAGAMIGIALQQAGRNVLVVEFTGLPGASSAGPFVNGASGLPTVVRPLAAGMPTFPPEEGLAGDVDFLLLIGPPLAAQQWDMRLFAPADLLLFTLDPVEDATRAHALMRRRLGKEDMARSATLVVAGGQAAGDVTPLSVAAQ